MSVYDSREQMRFIIYFESASSAFFSRVYRIEFLTRSSREPIISHAIFDQWK